jgi:hypothetical protein
MDFEMDGHACSFPSPDGKSKIGFRSFVHKRVDEVEKKIKKRFKINNFMFITFFSFSIISMITLISFQKHGDRLVWFVIFSLAGLAITAFSRINSYNTAVSKEYVKQHTNYLPCPNCNKMMSLFVWWSCNNCKAKNHSLITSVCKKCNTYTSIIICEHCKARINMDAVYSSNRG